MRDNKELEEIEKKLNREIKERKTIIDAFSRRFEELSQKLIKDTDGYKISKMGIDSKIEELKKMKAEMTGYVLKIISTVIGLLGLIMTISFLALKTPSDNDFLWFCTAILILFLSVFLAWFYLWMRTEKIFEFCDTKWYKVQKSMANKFVVIVILYLITIAIFTLHKIFPIDTPLYLFIFLFVFGLLLVVLSLLRSYSNSES